MRDKRDEQAQRPEQQQTRATRRLQARRFEPAHTEHVRTLRGWRRRSQSQE